MRQITTDAPAGSTHDDVLTLPFELRQKSRLRAKLETGEEVALLMPRGRILRDGDRLSAGDGRVVLVKAAPEELSTVRAADPTSLARAAYHLGNRHIAVQVGHGWLRYQHDHVLDEMLRALGLAVHAETAAFEPEAGAYAQSQDHDDDHDHEHGHARG